MILCAVFFIVAYSQVVNMSYGELRDEVMGQ